LYCVMEKEMELNNVKKSIAHWWSQNDWWKRDYVRVNWNVGTDRG